MLTDKKKLSIILAAISAYLTETEKSAIKELVVAPGVENAWRMAGLQETMEMRRLVQLRFLKAGR